MSQSDSAVNELAAKLDAALILDEKQSKDKDSLKETAESVVTQDAEGAGSAAIVSGPASSEENDAYSVPSDTDSVSSSDSDSDVDDIYEGAAPPLTVHVPLLDKGMSSLFSREISTLDSIAQMIKTRSVKNIIVMAGAGISTSAGIPDFRSPKTGIYANLKQFNLPHAEAIFTIDYFRKNPKPFYVLAKELYPGQFAPTASHFFVKLLERKRVLRRHYTQNIDCLERVAGISPERIVEAHGSFHTAHCIESSCNKEHSQDWVKEKIMDGKIPHCTLCKSLVKPDITFFGENLPSRFFDLLEDDFSSCDLLIVLGTSLLVQPFASLVNEVKSTVPRMLINRVRAGESRTPDLGFNFDGKRSSGGGSKGTRGLHRDALILGDCDAACGLLADRLGWKKELLELQRSFRFRQSLDNM
ncbi:NAD-dependent protein deacetylase sirtuin-2 [Coemansia sp. RSA 2399]|nr:NAD-dependent protein deacetylase sirtuin-2 [Coemansia sp. RSA 2399]KAJ1907081.1 NAD-dependent protein deacetylase sirtuin-2 [Coemansia sp. IMI 209127]